MKKILLPLLIILIGCDSKKVVKKSPGGEYYIVEGNNVLKTDSLGNLIGYENLDIVVDTTSEIIETKIENLNGKWEYKDEIDPMTEKHTKTASVKSNNTLQLDFPYQGGSEAKLWIRRWKGDLDIFVTVRPSQMVFKYDNKYVSIKIDDSSAKNYSIIEAADYSSDIFFINNEKSFLEKLKKSKKVLVEVTFYEQGNHVLEFDTDKLVFD